MPAPGYKPTPSQEKLKQRAEEKERAREALHNGTGVTKAHYNYTFSVDTTPVQLPMPTAKKSERKPSFKNVTKPKLSKSTSYKDDAPAPPAADEAVLRFPTLFSSSFSPIALLNPRPTASGLTYGEDAPFSFGTDFGAVRPTFELALDEILSGDAESPPPADGSSLAGFSEAVDAMRGLVQGSTASPEEVKAVTEDDNGGQIFSQAVRRSPPLSCELQF